MARSNNPYTPPRAPLQDNSRPSRGSPWKAILFGVTTDVGGTLIASVVLSILATLIMGDDASDPETLRNYLDSGIWQILAIVLGSVCTLLGGYVAARVANYAEYRYAAISSLLALVLSELFASAGGDSQGDFGLRVAGWIVTVPLAMLGARWRLLQKASMLAASAEPPAADRS